MTAGGKEGSPIRSLVSDVDVCVQGGDRGPGAEVVRRGARGVIAGSVVRLLEVLVEHEKRNRSAHTKEQPTHISMQRATGVDWGAAAEGQRVGGGGATQAEGTILA